MTLTTLRESGVACTTKSGKRTLRAGVSMLAAVAVSILFETHGSTMAGGDRVRIRWDWATDAAPWAAGQNASPGRSRRERVPLVTDFSSRQVIFPEVLPAKVANVVQRDARFMHQYLRRHAHRYVPLDPDYVQPPWLTQSIARDWSFSLNNGNGGTIGFPAKYVFDVTAAPSCTTDFVVTGLNIAGSATQANLMGFNSLYNTPAGNGLCAGTAPTVMFSYRIGPGVINSYITLSLDGTKVAFNENNGANSYFHVLRWATGAGNGTTAALPAVPGTGNTALDVKLPLTGGTSTAPFVDYANDVAYVTTSNNVVHKFTGVFDGTPTEVTGAGTGWPATTGFTGNSISTPVFDPVSRHVIFTDSDQGGIDYIDDSVVPAVVHVNQFLFAPGMAVAAPVVVDAGNQKVYAFSPNPTGAAAVVAQADTSLSLASQVTVSIGGATNNLAPLMGDLNDAYYNGQSATARLYVVGNDGSANRVPALYAIGFNASFKMNPAYSNGPLALATNNAGIGSSPVTAFYNTTLAKQFLFIGITNRCSAAVTGGCIRSLDVTSAFPTSANVNNVILAASGGTSGITIDNVSAAAGASSVYYTTLTGRTIVKATQAGLQ